MNDQSSEIFGPSARRFDAAAVVPASGSTALVKPGVLGRFHEWVVEHDDSKLFLGLYVGLAVVLSIWISLFWLVVVVAVHLGFEIVRQSRYQATRRAVVLEALWELKLDVALVVFALVLTLYMEMVLGVVGLQGAARLGAASRVATRFAGWERTLRGLLLSLDDAAQIARATVIKRGRAAAGGEPAVPVDAPLPAVASPRWGSWAGPYGTGARISLGIGVTCTLLILAAPWLTPHSAVTAMAALAMELRPLP